MDPDHAVVHLSLVAVVLSPHPHGVAAALAHARFIERAQRVRVSVLTGHQLLSAIAQFSFIPLDRFEKAL